MVQQLTHDPRLQVQNPCRKNYTAFRGDLDGDFAIALTRTETINPPSDKPVILQTSEGFIPRISFHTTALRNCPSQKGLSNKNC